jgi:hypothetical protein
MYSFWLNLYVLALFPSKYIPRFMEEREEDLFFSIFTHMHDSFFQQNLVVQ